MAQYEEIREALQRKLQELQQRTGKIEQNLRATPDPDAEEQALDRENDEVLERLDHSSRQEMDLIHAALERIAAGTYGVCTHCGNAIAAQRLAALPYTTTCIACAR